MLSREIAAFTALIVRKVFNEFGDPRNLLETQYIGASRSKDNVEIWWKSLWKIALYNDSETHNAKRKRVPNSFQQVEKSYFGIDHSLPVRHRL